MQDYEPPELIDVGNFDDLTCGSYAKDFGDDSAGAGYWLVLIGG